MKAQNIRRMIAIALFLAGIFLSLDCGDHADDKTYYCPMHPDYTSQRPGDCPICGMKLVAKKEESQSEDHKPQDPQNQDLHNHSNKSQNTPNQTGHDPNGKQTDLDPSPSLTKPHSQSFQISLERQKSIGVKTAQAKAQNMESRILSSGQIVYDTELYTAFVEYTEAWKVSQMMDRSFLQSAKMKLIRLGLDDSNIRVWSQRSPEIFLSGRSGRHAYVFTQVFERDLRHLKLGQKVEVEANSYPGKVFPGKIIGWFKLVDEKNRSTRAWVEVHDPQNLLQPRMFTETKMEIPLGKVLTVPRTAVMHTGIRDLVYVKLSEDKFQPRSVTIGEESENSVQILSGLQEGDEVVVGANFLIDSEARMQLGRNL